MSAILQDVGAIDRRDIPGYEGIYAITRDGRVWAYARRWETGGSMKIRRSRAAGFMRTHKTPAGYVMIKLSTNGRAKHELVHRLVALAWIPNPDGLPQINHLNAIKSDNRAENLEWCTASGNRRHAFGKGLITFNDNFRAAVRENAKKAHAATRKLSYEEADQVRARFASGETKTVIAKDFGINRSTVWAIVNGKTYVR